METNREILGCSARSAALDTKRRVSRSSLTNNLVIFLSIFLLLSVFHGRAQSQAITALTGDCTATGPGSVPITCLLDAKFVQGADPTGSADSTTAIQNAINAASALVGNSIGGHVNSVRLFLAPGTYKITSALVLPGGVHLMGGGRNFSTIIKPANCGLFIIDGSRYAGGWDFRIEVSDIQADLSNASAADAVYINSAYSVEFDNFALYGQPAGVTNGIHVKTSNNIVIKDLIEWGSSNSSGVGILVDGSTAFTSVKLLTPDIEIFATGVSATGLALLDMISPYSENCGITYNHAISSGMVNIYGGYLAAAVSGNVINIAGDGLVIHGTTILPGSTGITAASAAPFKNVQLLDIPAMSQANFFGPGTNLLALGFVQPSLVNDLFHQTYDFVKTPASGTAASILNLNNFQNFAKFKLTVMATVGAAVVIKQFDFAVTSNTTIGSTDPIVTTLSSFTNGNWGLSLGTITLTASGNNIVVGITASSSGSLGKTYNPILYCSLELFAFSSTSTGAVVLD